MTDQPDPTAIAQRVISSDLSKEIGESMGTILGGLAGFFGGDLVAYFSDEPGVNDTVRELAYTSMLADANLVKQFVNEIVHMARKHGLEETKKSFEIWKQRLQQMDDNVVERIV